jgi:hypothetical protein
MVLILKSIMLNVVFVKKYMPEYVAEKEENMVGIDRKYDKLI